MKSKSSRSDYESDINPNHTDEFTQTESQKNIPDVITDGGAVIHGNVSVNNSDFAGRDLNKTIVTEETSYDVRGLPNPYLGLRAFSFDDRFAFGGREQSIREGIAKLSQPGAQQTLLFIVGASGSGKSSFAQAGLLPALETHYQERHKITAKAIFRPSSHPLAMLADALAQLGLPELPSQELELFTPEEFAHFLFEKTPKRLSEN